MNSPRSVLALAVTAFLGAPSEAHAQTGLAPTTLAFFQGDYSVACQNPSAPHVRVSADALTFDGGKGVLTGRNPREDRAGIGPNPPPGYQTAIVSDISGNGQVSPFVFKFLRDQEGLYVMLDGDAKVRDIFKAMLAWKFKRCPGLPARHPAPPPAHAPIAPVQAPQLSPAPSATGGPPAPPPGSSRCRPGVPGVGGLTSADYAAVKKITEDSTTIIKVDLNGDAQPDFIVVDSANCGTAGCVTDVYVSRNGAHEHVFSSDLMSEVNVATTDSRGMCDLDVDGIRYAWDGKKYVAKGAIAKAKRPPEPKAQGPAKPLESYAGKKGFSEIFSDDPALDKAFKKLLGKRYIDFFNHFTISDSAVIDQGYLIGDGCQVHECDSEFAVGAIRLADRALFAAMISLTPRPDVKTFSSSKGPLPPPVKAHIDNILETHQLWPSTR